MVNSKKGTFLTFLLLILPITIRGLDDPLWRNKLRVFKSLEVSSIWLLQSRGTGVWGSCGGGVGVGGRRWRECRFKGWWWRDEI